MRTCCAVFVLTAWSTKALADPCGESDLSCLHRALLEKADELDSARRQITSYRELDRNSQERIKLLQQDNVDLANAVKPVLDAVKAAQPKFYDTVQFGLAVGIPIGVVITVLAGLAVAAAARNLVVLR